MEMVTDLDNGNVDEEGAFPTEFFVTPTEYYVDENGPFIHTRKILHYKRLLERAQASTAAQLHALQAEVRVLRHSPSEAVVHVSHQLLDTADGLCVCGSKKRKGYWSGHRMTLMTLLLHCQATQGFFQ